MRPVSCHSSVRNYQHTPPNKPEEGRAHLFRGGILKTVFDADILLRFGVSYVQRAQSESHTTTPTIRQKRKVTISEFNEIYKTMEGHAVAQLVEALRYKSEDRGFDSQWCLWNSLLT
jgi:hypothetical protein